MAAKKKPGKVKRILPGVHAPTMKKGKARKKLSPAEKLKRAKLAAQRKAKMSAKDKHFDKVRGKVTANRRNGKKAGNKSAGVSVALRKKHGVILSKAEASKIAKSGNVEQQLKKLAKKRRKEAAADAKKYNKNAGVSISKNAGRAAAKKEKEAIKQGKNVIGVKPNGELITTKAGKQLPVKWKQAVKVGNKTIHVPFSRAPSKNNPIAELNRWKKVISHLDAESKSAKGKQRQQFEKAIANAKTQMKKQGHKIPNFVKTARDKNPSLIGRAKKRAEDRKAKRLAAKAGKSGKKVGVSNRKKKGVHQYIV